MKISLAATRSGLPAKTIRYYEEIGLVHPVRKANGYRDYAESDVHRLRLLRCSRGVGFSIDSCRQLLSLFDEPGGTDTEAKVRARAQLTAIDQKIAELAEFRDLLSELVANPHWYERREGRTLDDPHAN